MNAFLAVKTYDLDVKSFEDVLDKEYEFLTYHHSSTSDLFKNGEKFGLWKRLLPRLKRRTPIESQTVFLQLYPGLREDASTT